MAKKGFLSRLFGSGDDDAKAKDIALEEQSDAIPAPDAGDQGDAAADAAEPISEEELPAQSAPEMLSDEQETGDDPAGSEESSSIDVQDASDESADEPETEDAIADIIEPSVAEDVETSSSDETIEETGSQEEELEQPAPTAVAAQTASPDSDEKLSWFQRLRRGLSRSSGALGEGISAIFTKRKLDDDVLQDLEDILIQADLGVETAMTITDRLSDGRYNKEVTDRDVQEILAEEVDKVLAPVAMPLEITKPESGPHVILMIGVNGAGKTTTIGKLAQKFADEGKSVMLAAGDTFRAAAIDQLKVWGQRTGAPVVAREVGADAAGLAFDAMQEAKEQGKDILMIDTAGRLQNRSELMAELEKIVRVIKKHDASAPHSVLLVLDATTGQNALNQVEVFSKMAGVTGLVMTKLDGTARGGILVAISAKHKVPVHFIGVGEGVADLEPFESLDFARAIAGLAED